MSTEEITLKAARTFLGLSKVELAGKMGISVYALTGIESGRRPLLVDHAFALSKLLGKPIECFLGKKKEYVEHAECLIKKMSLEQLRKTVSYMGYLLQ